MLRGHTPKEQSKSAKEMHSLVKETLGSDFAAKSKSNRRAEFRDWRKENGQGDASFRRYLAKRMK